MQQVFFKEKESRKNIHTTAAIYFIYSITDAPKRPRSTPILPAPPSEHRELSLLIWGI